MSTRRPRDWIAPARRAVVLALVLVHAAAAYADRIEPASDAVRIGVQAEAFPFSHKVSGPAGPAGPVYGGYSVDLCLEIVKAWRQRQGKSADLQRDIRWVEVRPRTRLMQLLVGEIDLECSSTSHTEARRSLGIAFAPTHFVSDVGLLVHRDLKDHAESLMSLLSRVRARDWALVTTSGTTSVRHLQDLVDHMAAPNGRKLRVVFGSSHHDSLQKLRAPQPGAHAFVMDHVLLVAALARNPEYVKEGLSVVPWSPAPRAQECYGLMTRKTNPAHLSAGGQDFAEVVRDIVLGMRQPGDVETALTPMHLHYRRWFQSPLAADQLPEGSPAGLNLGMPPSSPLSQALMSMTAHDDCP